MCGIAGIIRVHPPHAVPPAPSESLPVSWLDTLDAGIASRGPDGSGRYISRINLASGATLDVALLHRRLSIIDPLGGAQPMLLPGTHSAHATLSQDSKPFPRPLAPHNGALVFNGCIYNHRQLRSTLRSFAFQTDHSDTEALVAAWTADGHNCFPSLDGMFALAVWDAPSQSLVLARDTHGEKPLYFLKLPTLPDHFAFASSPRPLASLAATLQPGLELAIDHLALANWLNFGWDSALPFANIHELPPSSSLRITPDASGRRFEFRSQVFAPQPLQMAAPRHDHAGDDFLALLESTLSQAIADRLDADVPVACFLSAGIDSAIVAAITQKHRRDVPCFTVRMSDPALDESTGAAQTASHLGLRHHILVCQPTVGPDLERLVGSLLLPFGDSSLLPSTWLARETRRHVKVALGGDGGDELFLGYERQGAIPLLRALSHLPPSVLDACAQALPIGPFKSRRSRVARLLSAAATADPRELLSIFPRHIRLWPAQSNTPRLPLTLDRSCNIDLAEYLPFDLMRKSDTASMSSALEVRSPLLSRGVTQLASSLSAHERRREGPKWILRALAAKYLPPEITTRGKSGFSIPISRWFKTDHHGLRTMLADLLSSQDPFPEFLLGPLENPTGFGQRMLSSHTRGCEDHGHRLYSLLVLALWCQSVKRLRTHAD